MSDVRSVQFVIPYCMDMKALQTQYMRHKFVEGPVGYINLRPTGVPDMGKSLGQWFALTLFVSLLATVSAAIALPIGAAPEPAFAITFLVPFAAAGCGRISGGILTGQHGLYSAVELSHAVNYATATR